MAIYSEGAINLSAQIVPGVFTTLVPPRVQIIQGIPTNIVGLVGTASWGPLNNPVPVGGYSEHVRWFGPMMNRARDLGTMVAIANQAGAANFRCVRVSDGTDTAAQVIIQTNCLTLTSKYSGSGGNNTQVAVGPGSKSGTYRVTVSLAQFGFLPEVFDNIAGSGNALWVNIAAAINDGQFSIRSGSEVVIATAGVGSTAPATATYTLTGGTDGVTSMTDAMLVGLDTTPRTGMYALRGSGATLFALSDVTDTSTWAAQNAYAKSEGAYAVLTGPKGDTVSGAVTAKATAGLDDWGAKVLMGDWVYWLDNQNGIPERLVSPQPFALGRLATLSPEQSSLNKPVLGVVGTQRTKLARPYSEADLQVLGSAGIDVLTNPVPGGAYFGFRFGRNASSNPTIRGDNYTRMSNFLAISMDRAVGRFIGRLHSERMRREVKLTLDTFLGGMTANDPGRDDGMIDDFQVQCDEANNPANRRGAGWIRADVQVKYLAIVEFFQVALEGGQTVQIVRQRIATAAGGAAA